MFSSWQKFPMHWVKFQKSQYKIKGPTREKPSFITNPNSLETAAAAVTPTLDYFNYLII